MYSTVLYTVSVYTVQNTVQYSRVGKIQTYFKIRDSQIPYMIGLSSKFKDQSRKGTFLCFEFPHSNGGVVVQLVRATVHWVIQPRIAGIETWLGPLIIRSLSNGDFCLKN